MLTVETIAKVRRTYHRDKKSIRQIAKDMNLARNTVRKIIRSAETEMNYERKSQPLPQLEPHKKQLIQTLKRIYKNRLKDGKVRSCSLKNCNTKDLPEVMIPSDGLSNNGVDRDKGSKVFIPLAFAPGEAFQFDWSYEQIELGGCNAKIKLAHFRLCYSRELFSVAYMREALEMVLDTHVQAFQLFGGSCRKGIYDNLKTVVSKVLTGKQRFFN
jgi:transposase